MDECANNEAGCDLTNGYCHNTTGSYECRCYDGYEIRKSEGKICFG